MPDDPLQVKPNLLTSPIQYLRYMLFEGTGYIIGILAPFIAGGATLRGIQQATNLEVPNELLPVGEAIEAYRRGNYDLSSLEGSLALQGFDKTKQDAILGNVKALLNIADLTTLHFRKSISRDELYKQAAKLGIDQKMCDEYSAIATSRLDPLWIVQAWRRGYFSETSGKNYFDDLSDLGWSDDRIQLWKEVTRFQPPPTDIVRFLQRDVFIPEFVEKFGMDKEYPTDADPAFEKVGVDHATAINYWRAHWELPSITQGYEMYQRGYIEETDLRRLMRAQGVEPYWRDPLIAVAYQPFTRIDIRRMMQVGVLDHDAAVVAFKNIGYSPSNALQITQFYEKYNLLHPMVDAQATRAQAAEFHGLTAKEIEDAYTEGVVTRDQAIAYFEDIKIHKDIAELRLRLVDYKVAKGVLKVSVDAAKDEFMLGLKTLDEVQQEMALEGIPEHTIVHTLASLSRTRKKRTTLPTKAELDKLIAHGTIDEGTYIAELQNLGYADKYIGWFVALKGGVLQVTTGV